MNPLEQLKSILCDPSGKCCISGSAEDRAIVDRALKTLAEPTAPSTAGERAEYLTLSAIRAIAVEAIRAVTGCPDIKGNGKYLVDEIDDVAKHAALLQSTHDARTVGELTTCNCRWNGEEQVQSCTLHAAHVDAIHEWAERAKTAESELAAARTQPAGELTVDVFYLDGHDPFICGVYGKLSLGALSDIELDIQRNPDFKKGDGTYSYSVTRFEGQYGFEGRCELAPGWELYEERFTPIDATNGITGGDQ